MWRQKQLFELLSHCTVTYVETRIYWAVGPSNFFLLNLFIVRLGFHFLLLVKCVSLGPDILLAAGFEFFFEVLRGQIFAQLRF